MRTCVCVCVCVFIQLDIDNESDFYLTDLDIFMEGVRAKTC